MSAKFIAVDFFCGAGGTTNGLINAGGYVVAGIDIDASCKRTYQENNRNRFADKALPLYLEYDIFPKSSRNLTGGQQKLIPELRRLLRGAKLVNRRVPLLFAICAPCQPFSRFSRKLHTNERRIARERDQNLLLEACKFVEIFKPDMILSENVAGIGDGKYGNIWIKFREKLNKLGYATGSKVVCTSRFGIPQFRKRSILTAIRKNRVHRKYMDQAAGFDLMIPGEDKNAQVIGVSKALKHLPPLKAGQSHPKIPNHIVRDLHEINIKRISCALPGQNNSYLKFTKYGDLSLDCHKRVNRRTKAKCYSDVYTRMHPDRPSPTITTRCHSISNGRFGHYDMKQIRGISSREAAILQSFPDNYVFYPVDQTEPIARMIGNAVPPKLAEFYAKYLLKSLKPRTALAKMP